MISRIFRLCIAVLVIATSTLVTSTYALATPTASTTLYLPVISKRPPPQVAVTGYRTYYANEDATDTLYVIGEITNTTTKTAYNPLVTTTVFSVDGTKLTEGTVDTHIRHIEPGQHVAFKDTFPGKDVGRLDFAVSYHDQGYYDYRSITVISNQRQSTQEPYGIDNTGIVRNNQQQGVGVIAVDVIGYDANGMITSVSFGNLEAELAVLAPGETSTYHTLPFIPAYATSVYTYTVLSEGIAQ